MPWRHDHAATREGFYAAIEAWPAEPADPPGKGLDYLDDFDRGVALARAAMSDVLRSFPCEDLCKTVVAAFLLETEAEALAVLADRLVPGAERAAGRDAFDMLRDLTEMALDADIADEGEEDKDDADEAVLPGRLRLSALRE